MTASSNFCLGRVTLPVLAPPSFQAISIMTIFRVRVSWVISALPPDTMPLEALRFAVIALFGFEVRSSMSYAGGIGRPDRSTKASDVLPVLH
jgi:hypothetical protein